MSLEVRYGGVDVLADPGTYCYHGEPAWRSYFRSTIAHNTLELGGRNQSGEGGPFLWLRHANGREIERRRHRRHRGVDRRPRRLPVAAPAGPAPPLGPAGPRRRAVSASSTRSAPVATTSGWPSISAPMCRPSSTAATRSCAGPPRARRGRRGWNCRRGCDGACTAARPIRSSAGTHPAWASACRPLPCWAAGRGTPGVAFTTRLDFLDTGKTEKPIDTGSAVSQRPARSLVKDDAEDPSGGRMSGQALDLQRSAQIVRRYKILIGVAAAVGLLAGAGYAFLNPPHVRAAARWSCCPSPHARSPPRW